MKNFSLLFYLFFFLAVAVSAQTNQTSSCPTKIDVTGGELVKPGETMTFTAIIEGYDLSKLSYNWTVSSGEILEGQGTLSIKVLKKDDGENITATFEVKGLPEGCISTVSETGAVCSCVRPRLFDEFSVPASRIEKGILDSTVTELTENPQLQLFIVEYFKANTPKRTIKRKIQKITDYLLYEKQLEKDRFTILTVPESEQNLTKIWLVPPGAESPEL